MPEQVKTAIYMAARLLTPCPHNCTIPCHDSMMEAIKRKAEEDGFVSGTKEKNNKDKYINKGNQCSSPQSTFWKGVIHMIALQFYFNIRGGFSTATTNWKRSTHTQKQELDAILNIIVAWIRSNVPDMADVLFPCELSTQIFFSPDPFLIFTPMYILLLFSIRQRA